MVSKLLRVLVAVAVLGVCVALPTAGVAASASSSSARSGAAHRPHQKKRKSRCRKVRRRKGQKGRGRFVRVCPKPHKSTGSTPPGPTGQETGSGGGTSPGTGGAGSGGGTETGGGGYESGGGGGGGGETGGGGGGTGGGPTGKLPTIPAGDELVDLVHSNDFEEGLDEEFGVSGGSSSGSVAVSGSNPIEGAKSLQVKVNAFGRVGFYYEGYGFDQGPLVDTATTRLKLRVDAATGSASPLKLCTIVYVGQTPETACETVSVQDNSIVEPFITFDAKGEKIQRAYFQFELQNSGSVTLTVDDAHLFIVQKEGSDQTGSGGGGGGGGGSGGGGRNSCDLSKETAPDGPPKVGSPCDETELPDPGSPYQPTPVNLPASHPFISLDSYKQIASSNPIFTKFKNFVDGAVSHNEFGSEYSATYGVVMFARTGEPKYIEDAIKRVQKTVTAASAEIAQGNAPSIADDHYLDIGPDLEEVALTFDYGFSRLSEPQRAEWKAYGDKVLSNLWSPLTSTWGGNPLGTGDTTGWAINDPGDNYYYSFLEATEMWALATKSTPWIEFLQKYKFPQAESYFAELPGGGSREGTGYGVSQRRLWEDARMWKASTGENLSVIFTHARESAEYWLNATVPTLDYYAPIGDLSRSAIPGIFDYHVDLMHEAAAAAPGTPESNHALWWLQHNKHDTVELEGKFEVGDVPHFRSNLLQAMVTAAGTPTQPTALTYHAAGAGQFFGRSSWNENATWFQLTAGPYDQSHAHEDQGGFSLYRNTWLAVTSNIWSNSGLQGGGGGGFLSDLGVGVNNVVRFEKAGKAIDQNHGVSTETSETKPDGTIKVDADLTHAYSAHAADVKSWKRTVELHENDFKVHDTCEVGSGVTPVFELNVPVKPVDEGGGRIKAGALKLTAPAGYGVKFVDMTTFAVPGHVEFDKGWRIDLTNPAGCAFDVDLEALAAP